MHIRKRLILCMSVVLLFSCLSSAHAIENDRATMATKLLAYCYQAKLLYLDSEKFALPKGEKYLSLSTLNGAVYGTECFGYVLETSKKIFIVFRGSESYSDILRDFMIWKSPFTYVPDGGNVHTGFLSIYNGISEEQPDSLRDQIMSVLETLDPEKQLVVCGFSLGGAIATLCACDVAENTEFTNPIVYTFASPRVGDQQFVDTYNNRIGTNVRIINYQDYVPCNPLQWLGYYHVKGEVLLNVNTGRLDNNHKIDIAYFPGLVANVPEYKEKIMKKYADLCPPLPEVLPDPSWEEKEEKIEGDDEMKGNEQQQINEDIEDTCN